MRRTPPRDDHLGWTQGSIQSGWAKAVKGCLTRCVDQASELTIPA